MHYSIVKYKTGKDPLTAIKYGSRLPMDLEVTAKYFWCFCITCTCENAAHYKYYQTRLHVSRLIILVSKSSE
jgi:hypothetical protein